MERYMCEYRRDAMSAQAVYPAEISKLMGLQAFTLPPCRGLDVAVLTLTSVNLLLLNFT